MRFARKMIRSGCQAPIRAFTQWRFYGMKADILVWNLVRSFKRGRARHIVVKLPSGKRAITLNAARDIDHARRPEIGPREFFLLGPKKMDQLPCSLRQSPRL